MENIFLLEEVLKFQKLSGLISEKDYKSNLKKISNFEDTVLGTVTKELQKEYVNNIERSGLFNESECKYLKNYFKTYDSINESNIRKHNLLLKEGFFGDVAKFFGDAWNKIKQVYGNIKDFVLKVWEYLKTNTIKICNTVYTYTKNQLVSKKQAFLNYLNKPEHHQLLEVEFKKCDELYTFFKGYIKTFWDNLSNKVLNNPELSQVSKDNLKEIFTSRRMFKLFEGEGGFHPEDFIKNPAANKIVKWIMKLVKLILNPVAFIVTEGTKWGLSKMFLLSNKLAKILGGIGVIKWAVLPAAVVAVMEVMPSVHHIVESWGIKVLGLFFEYMSGSGVIEMVHIAGYIYTFYAIYEYVAIIKNDWYSRSKKSVQQPVAQAVQ